MNNRNTLLLDCRALKLVRVGGILLLFMILWFVGSALFRSLRLIDWNVVAIDGGRILSGILTVTMGVLAGTWTCRKLYGELGERLSWQQAFVLLFVPAAGKYLPGKCFAVAGHVAIAKGYGIVIRVSGSSVLFLTGMGVLTSTVLGLVLILPEYAAGRWGALVFVGTVATSLLLLVCLLRPRLYWRMVNSVLTIMKQPTVEATLGVRAMAEVLLGSLLQNGFYVCGVSLMVLGTMEVPLSALPAIVGASCIAGVSGLLAFFAPAGIGVREGVLLGMLMPIVGAGPAGVITILTRILQTVVDIVLALGGTGVLYSSPARQGP
jgi:glycosyltransferase 2 family protein